MFRSICILWTLALLAKRAQLTQLMIPVAAGGLFLILAHYAVIFGRTIWPALDQGIGGTTRDLRRRLLANLALLPFDLVVARVYMLASLQSSQPLVLRLVPTTS